MQVHSLPRANTPLLQSITLSPQINWQLNLPRFAIPSPSLPGWGQRAVCGTKPTQGIAVYHTSLMSYLPGSPHPQSQTTPPPTPFLFSTWVMQAKLFITGMDTLLFSPKHAPLCYSIENLSSNNTMEYLPAFWSCFWMSLRAMDNTLREWDPAWHLTM